MRAAEFSQSDLDFAGLMIRCGHNNGIEVLFVVIDPFPPHAQPKVTVGTGPTKLEFAASVVPPGLLVLLPAEAAALAEGPWQAAADLRVRIEDEQQSVGGMVPSAGLGSALNQLRSNCPPN